MLRERLGHENIFESVAFCLCRILGWLFGLLGGKRIQAGEVYLGIAFPNASLYWVSSFVWLLSWKRPVLTSVYASKFRRLNKLKKVQILETLWGYKKQTKPKNKEVP